jgi:hypothetical protein
MAEKSGHDVCDGWERERERRDCGRRDLPRRAIEPILRERQKERPESEEGEGTRKLTSWVNGSSIEQGRSCRTTANNYHFPGSSRGNDK